MSTVRWFAAGLVLCASGAALAQTPPADDASMSEQVLRAQRNQCFDSVVKAIVDAQKQINALTRQNAELTKRLKDAAPPPPSGKK